MATAVPGFAGKKQASFSARDRETVRVFVVENYGRGQCPPGLALKGGACLPPGQAGKRYLRGEPLPATVAVEPLPAALDRRIGAPPAGFRYGMVDGDVVKLELETLRVVDVIEALVE
jgi:hypothetical protein